MTVTFDIERQQKASEYARIRRRLSFASTIVSMAYIILWLATGWFIGLREWVFEITTSQLIAVPLYAFLFALPLSIIDLPLSYYSGFVLPHRYELSTQSLKEWIMDQLKGLAISTVLGILILEIIYWLLGISPDWWWLWAGGVMLLFTVLLAQLAPILIMPLFYTFTPLEDEDLSARLENLASDAGYQVKGVFRFDMSSKTKAANAAVMGLGSTRRIVLGDTLLEEFTADEIETVLAHELAHLVHRDVPLLVALNTILTLLGFFIAHLVMGWAVGYFGLTGLNDPATLPLFGLVGGVVGFIVGPMGNAFSRWRERMADTYALNATGKAAAFADALTRLANQNLGEYDPERWVVLLFYSHPPLKERVESARSATT